jgi:hypothetical protein
MRSTPLTAVVNRDTAVGLLRRTPCAPRVARVVATPPDARRLTTLSDVDYEDAFLMETYELTTGWRAIGAV